MAGVAGLAVSVFLVIAYRGGPAVTDWARFAKLMTAASVAGLILRGLRRKAFFGRRASFHKAFSLDATLQGAILLHPQLPYPSVEASFVSRNTGVPGADLKWWFRVRSTAAVAIPLLLAGVVFLLAGRALPAAVCIAAALMWTGARAFAPHGKTRFLLAMLFGLSAAVAEGWLFTEACLALYPGQPAAPCFLLYSLLLAGFELSPVPFALGVLEVLWLGLSLIPGLTLPGILVAFAYRCWRGLPVLLLTLFYLPRYKMKVSDLYDPNLADALARTHPRATTDARSNTREPFISFVLPAFNEEARLPVYLPQVQEFCRERAGRSEIVIVDDGSTDGTAAYVESVAARDPAVRLVKQPFNQGKGAAVRRGVSEARGDYILFADSDGATPIREAAKLIEACRDGADVVIGSRKAEGGGTQRSRSLIRGMIGSMFYRITNLLAVPDILDTQCGFKLFRRGAAEKIFPLLREKGWAFDVEILFLAQKFGMTIAEVPVNWTAVEGSKVKPSDGLRFFIALFRIRRRTSGLTGSSDPVSAHTPVP